ncbi:MAG: isoprenylcysteine carboxylmethyltransferase family protein [Candidatus Hydrogenedentes bacterium]|nr:isoprenylcysteine carboxylmethyltransferase family protein [Candidatus Hydrogenedentota bacterium]
MKKTIFMAYGVVAYLAFFATILYMIGFVGGFGVPKDINDGAAAPLGTAIAINLALVLAFAVQHTIMARPAFKRWWTRHYMPKPVERSTFVLVASAILALTFWQWRPIHGEVWRVDAAIGQGALYVLFALGWGLVFYSSFLINHFDLFGLRQVFLYFRKRPYTHIPVKVVSLYKLVRNPLMLGFLIAMWATPTMTAGHLLFAVAMTVYILIGIQFEERTLSKELGDEYRAYRARTPMLLPVPRGAAAGANETNPGLALAGDE